jgi:hypothetical protein
MAEYGRVQKAPRYVYQELSVQRQEFRLLSLLPASDKQDALSCSLSIYSLSQELPGYEALSYTWGEFNGYKHEILVDGCILRITSKLRNILFNLRDATRDRVLWIDAMCICMEDLHERGFQVGVMKHIFAHAQRVVIWLDEPTTALPVLEDVIVRSSVTRGRNAERVQDVLGTHYLLKAFCRNFSHPWFCRVWTLQEYTLARSTVFVWGGRFFDGVVVVQCVAELWRALDEGDYTSVMTPEAFEQLREDLSGLLYFDWIRQKSADGGLDELDFMRILVASQALEAIDPRDKIFALLSLAPPTLIVNFRLDYTHSLEEVYRSLGQAMSLATRVETIFSSISTSYLANEAIPMPDWMPGWIEDLSLRVSDLLGFQSTMADSTQEAVIGCLEVITSYQREAREYLHLSRTEKNQFGKSLRDAHNILAYFLAESELTVHLPPLSPGADRHPSISLSKFDTDMLHSLEDDDGIVLNPVDDNFSDSGYNSASSYAENTNLVASEIADTLLAHGYFRRLLSAAGKLEHRDDILARYLRPCIRHLGNLLDPMASDSEELLAARELKRHAHFIARAIVSRTRKENFEEDQAVKSNRRNMIVRLLDEQGFLKPSSRLHDTVDQIQRVPPEGADHSGIPESSFDDGALPKTALDKVKEFMTTETALLPFLYRISRIVYDSPIEIIDAEIRACILSPYSEDSVNTTVEFGMSWDIAILLTGKDTNASARTRCTEFLRSLVISGTVESCYATNCESYLVWRWPDMSEPLLRHLKDYVVEANYLKIQLLLHLMDIALPISGRTTTIMAG